ncbi:MAG: nucleotidyl transferase AbiEii/AbiGii toxin family protein [Deltaproteobacteria bacterium]|nr:nucleotidyl transferase AbiEii/AbiGii toxin family protein [Deltaproteobacteria bacterium]
MDDSLEPSFELAERTLPAPLLASLVDLFEGGLTDSVLVGGTALSGFYAAHRRSDDLDIYTESPDSFRAAGLAVRGLAARGVSFGDGFSSAHYQRTSCERAGHRFTIDLVLDARFFEVGKWHAIEKGICVASLETLLMMKSAALVSRASEKDLYDLIWLFGRFPDLTLDAFIEHGQRIDAGLNRESLLLSVSGAELHKAACGFALDPSLDAARVLAQIGSFRAQLVRELADIRKVKPPVQLEQIVKRVKKLR